MDIQLHLGEEEADKDWGASYQEVKSKSDLGKVFICHVTISNLSKIANELSKTVMDKSWIMDLDPRAERAYATIAAKTAEKLVDIFENKILSEKGKISTDFGEIMISMGASRALEIIFSHIAIPIAELWKPKLTGNEGFDFHTICPDKLINFGEAKFSSNKNPYGGNSGDSTGAGGQADGFILDGKHLMDNVHLPYLAGDEAANNLDEDLFGIVLAFSINSQDPLNILESAVKKALSYTHLKQAQNIYIVGVTDEST